jgi:hypothetical protein
MGDLGPQAVVFDSGDRAVLLSGDGDDVRRLVREVGLPADADRAVIVVCGGADDLTDGASAVAAAVLGRAVARAAEATGAVVVDGGTDAGVMALVGQARRERPSAVAALVGVAPAGRVALPGAPADDRAPLEPNHTHFVLADSDEWGGETELLFDVAAALAGGGRLAVVVAGGGTVTPTEVLEAVRRGWPVFVIEGTGGTADEIAALWRRHRMRQRRRFAWLLPHGFKHRRQPPPSEIDDPGLRRIASDGDVHLFAGTDPGQLARRLAWELQDEPALKSAWRTFATYDELAGSLRSAFERFQRWILVLGILATFLALLHDAIGGAALHWAVVAAPILVAVLIALANRRAAGKRWVLLRAAAESVKAEIYRYRTGTGDYAEQQLADADPAARPQVLAARLDAIESRLLQTDASSGPLSPYAGELPPRMYGAARDDDGLAPLDADDYLRIRVGDQLGYYHGRIRGLDRRRNALQVVGVAAGGAGAILAAAGAEVWIGLTTAVSGAALSYLGHLQIDNSIVVYNQSAGQLAALQRGWNALRPSERSAAAFETLVTGAESAVTTELGGWVQQMNTALEELQSQQADQPRVLDARPPTVPAPSQVAPVAREAGARDAPQA